MKELFKIMAKDIMDEHFTRKEYIVYGIFAPIALVAIMALAGWLESL
jgi:hypothetical protein